MSTKIPTGKNSMKIDCVSNCIFVTRKQHTLRATECDWNSEKKCYNWLCLFVLVLRVHSREDPSPTIYHNVHTYLDTTNRPKENSSSIARNRPVRDKAVVCTYEKARINTNTCWGQYSLNTLHTDTMETDWVHRATKYIQISTMGHSNQTAECRMCFREILEYVMR